MAPALSSASSAKPRVSTPIVLVGIDERAVHVENDGLQGLIGAHGNPESNGMPGRGRTP
jgi:hypothetical protein